MWNFVDRAVCLTVADSDRIHDFLEDTKRVGLDVEIDTGQRVQRTGVCGPPKMIRIHTDCCEDVCKEINNRHLRVIKQSYKRGDRNILIFEDDARWVNPMDESKLRNTLEWIQSHDPKMFFFGYISYPNVIGKPVNKDIVVIPNPLLTHAYYINRKGMLRILNAKSRIKEENIPLDSYYAHYMPDVKKYGVYPSLSYQCVEPFYYKVTVDRLGLGFIPFNSFMEISNKITYYALYTPHIIVVLSVIIIISSLVYIFAGVR